MQGIARQFDDLGRITIPVEYRRTLGLKSKDFVEICLLHNVVTIKPCADTPAEEITGVSRKFDDLGRIVVPKEFRKTLHVKEDDFIEIYLEKGLILLKVCRLQCVICGSEEEEKLIEYKGVLVCEHCVLELGQVEKILQKEKERLFLNMLMENQ